MFDWSLWVWYFMYVQAGLIVGVGLARKVAPKQDGEAELRYGLKSRFIVGFGLSFGLQLYNVDFMLVWTCSTLVSAVWSLYSLALVAVLDRLKSLNAMKLELFGLKQIILVGLGCDESLLDGLKTKNREEIVTIIRERVKKGSLLSEEGDISALAQMGKD